MKGWNGCRRNKLDQSIIVYNVRYGEVYGGSDPGRTVKKVEKDSDGYVPGGDFTLELDLSNRRFVMEVDNQKITLDGNIGDFQYSPIVIIKKSEKKWKLGVERRPEYYSPEITLL